MYRAGDAKLCFSVLEISKDKIRDLLGEVKHSAKGGVGNIAPERRCGPPPRRNTMRVSGGGHSIRPARLAGDDARSLCLAHSHQMHHVRDFTYAYSHQLQGGAGGAGRGRGTVAPRRDFVPPTVQTRCTSVPPPPPAPSGPPSLCLPSRPTHARAYALTLTPLPTLSSDHLLFAPAILSAPSHFAKARTQGRGACEAQSCWLLARASLTCHSSQTTLANTIDRSIDRSVQR